MMNILLNLIILSNLLFDSLSHLFKEPFVFLLNSLLVTMFHINICLHCTLFIKISQLQIEFLLFIINILGYLNVYNAVVISSLILIRRQFSNTLSWNFNSGSRLHAFWNLNLCFGIYSLNLQFLTQHCIIYIYIMLCENIIVLSFEYTILFYFKQYYQITMPSIVFPNISLTR